MWTLWVQSLRLELREPSSLRPKTYVCSLISAHFMSATRLADTISKIPWSRSHDYCDRRSRHARVGAVRRDYMYHVSEMSSQTSSQTSWRYSIIPPCRHEVVYMYVCSQLYAQTSRTMCVMWPADVHHANVARTYRARSAQQGMLLVGPICIGPV
jgi:hypothetical protein